MKHTHLVATADRNIIRLVELYASGHGIAITTASRLLTGSGDAVGRMIRDNMSLTARRAERITQTASDRWPEDLDWPDDIPRPKPSTRVGCRELRS